jgi:ferredoxin
MARIMIENLFKKTLEATDYSKTLLGHFEDHSIDWMQACGRKGRVFGRRINARAEFDTTRP